MLASFTRFLQGSHPAITAIEGRGPTIWVMTETTMHKVQRLAILAFMVAVTACLLALVFAQATWGPNGLPGVAMYALGAGFGLEFVISAWKGRGTLDPSPGRW